MAIKAGTAAQLGSGAGENVDHCNAGHAGDHRTGRRNLRVGGWHRGLDGGRARTALPSSKACASAPDARADRAARSDRPSPRSASDAKARAVTVCCEPPPEPEPRAAAAADRGGGVLHLLGCTLVSAALLLAYWGCSADFRLSAWTGP